MQINYKPLIIAMSAMALSACNDNNDHHNVDHTAPTAQVQTAYFIDSTISGLRYNSGSQQGVTGTDRNRASLVLTASLIIKPVKPSLLSWATSHWARPNPPLTSYC